MLKIITAIILILFTIVYVNAGNPNFEILKKGTLDNSVFIQSRAIKNSGELEEIKKSLNDGNFARDVDFDKEMILIVAAMNRNAVEINIDEIEKRTANILEVIYSVKELSEPKLSKLGIAKYPYLIAKIKKTIDDNSKIVFRENLKDSPIPSGTALDEDYRYTNILNTYQNLDLLDYMPLDVGNRWTYRIENNSKTYEVSQEVQSVSNGWSILNSYFGKPNIAMKIDQVGQLMISSKEGGLRTFYNDSVVIAFISEEIETPAGKFNDLMIVSLPENSKFWFKDVYAKNVGLIYHEHKSENGNGKYTLISADVRGKTYPN